MTAKEKALSLCQDFGYTGMKSEQTGFYTLELPLAKACAIIAVDEILSHNFLEPQLKRHIGNVEPTSNQIEYWFKVKTEINNL